MAQQRPDEFWVATCLRAVLPGVDVQQHDDGSRGRMHDLDLVRSGQRFGACEVTAAADPVLVELWNTMNDSHERWIEPGLVGGWSVVVLPGCRVKRLRSELPAILSALESQGIEEVLSVVSRRLSAEQLLLDELGVSRAWQHPTSFPGSIYCTVHGSGGLIPESSDALAEWLSIWLSEPGQRHNIDKLLAADVAERHIFVLVPGFTVAPFEVMNIPYGNRRFNPDCASRTT